MKLLGQLTIFLRSLQFFMIELSVQVEGPYEFELVKYPGFLKMVNSGESVWLFDGVPLEDDSCFLFKIVQDPVCEYAEFSLADLLDEDLKDFGSCANFLRTADFFEEIFDEITFGDSTLELTFRIQWLDDQRQTQLSPIPKSHEAQLEEPPTHVEVFPSITACKLWRSAEKVEFMANLRDKLLTRSKEVERQAQHKENEREQEFKDMLALITTHTSTVLEAYSSLQKRMSTLAQENRARVLKVQEAKALAMHQDEEVAKLGKHRRLQKKRFLERAEERRVLDLQEIEELNLQVVSARQVNADLKTLHAEHVTLNQNVYQNLPASWEAHEQTLKLEVDLTQAEAELAELESQYQKLAGQNQEKMEAQRIRDKNIADARALRQIDNLLHESEVTQEVRAELERNLAFLRSIGYTNSDEAIIDISRQLKELTSIHV